MIVKASLRFSAFSAPYLEWIAFKASVLRKGAHEMGAFDQGADATRDRYLALPRTLCFVMNRGDVLLLRRAANRRVFPNQFNGLGGHVERGEDVYAGALREIREESGLAVHSLRLRGIHNIDAGADAGILLFVFTAISEERDGVSDSPEGSLHWIPRDQLLDLDLVEDLPLVLPRVLSMRDDEPPYFAHVSYDEYDQIQVRFAPAQASA